MHEESQNIEIDRHAFPEEHALLLWKLSSAFGAETREPKASTDMDCGKRSTPTTESLGDQVLQSIEDASQGIATQEES